MIPAWLYNWIEKLDDPAMNIYANDSEHSATCNASSGGDCSCETSALPASSDGRDDWE